MRQSDLASDIKTLSQYRAKRVTIAAFLSRDRRDVLSDRIDERRALHALRDHIDCLLAAGASLVGRDPVQLSFQGRTLIVQHGMLLNENGHQNLIETLAELEWANKRTRDLAIDICIRQLDHAIKQSCDKVLDSSTPDKS